MIEADDVIVASGFWSAKLLADLGLDFPCDAYRSELLIVDAGEPLPDLPVVSDLVSLQYCRLEGSGQFLIGNSDHDAPENKFVDPDHYSNVAADTTVEKYADKVMHRFPGFPDPSVTHTYAGVYDVPPDWNPVIAPLAAVEGLIAGRRLRRPRVQDQPRGRRPRRRPAPRGRQHRPGHPGLRLPPRAVRRGQAPAKPAPVRGCRGDAVTSLDDIAQIGLASSGGYRRFAWTAADAELREWFAGAVAGLGLDLTEDRVGNQWAWWGGDPDTTPGVVTGSHLDSVPDGGAYDGPLGVVSSIAAVAALQADGFVPRRPIGLVNFVDEEGARFGVACSGSRVLTGALAADRALALTDGDGVSMAEALRAAGRAPEHLGRDDETLARIDTFVELHVEQGRLLADLDGPGHAVAVGSSIWPHGRWRFEFEGEANHAGTTRLVDRVDPMLQLAALIGSAREVAAAEECVATVGKVRVLPNGVNAIASHVTGWLDARGADEAAVRRVVPLLEARLGARAVEESWTSDTAFDPDLAVSLADLLGGAPVIGTGAGHDAGVLSAHGIRSAMLFVRNPTGVSHSPAEHADPADCEAGAVALATVLRRLAG